LYQGTKLADTLRDVQVLEQAIAHFLSTLVNLEQLDTISAEDRFSLLITHTLGHTAMIQLYRSTSSDDVSSFEKCVRAARSCCTIINQLLDQDFAFLDPIVAVSVITRLPIFVHKSTWYSRAGQ
jgi:hypothetical protein